MNQQIPKDWRPGVRMRRVGRELRKWRDQAGLKATDVARQLQWAPSKLSKLEHAAQPIQGVDVLALAIVYGVREPERERLFTAAATAKEPGWWSEYETVLSPAAADFVELESEASQERTLQTQIIPALLQTDEYSRELLRGAVPPPTSSTIEQRVQVRATRRARLHAAEAISVDAVIWEPALRMSIGGARVMREQLRHLVSLADLPNVTIRIVPANAGSYPALGSAYEVLSFAEDHLGDVAYLENLTYGVYLDLAEEVRAFRSHFEGAAKCALGPASSRTLLVDLARG
ncbi:transcriptional regulator [Actinoalloteichus sp. AHMU CJ021]|uniref:helix-turn-helix domain-containing protein n=1 Tax=Actinoalloteichus sp. AHMU CJ021 TaxID=2072503 RepID=UPI000CA072BA|nr:transcriptional regulator [Actinoalloteichus sp. AHMU CJ021]